tara:strand:- start:53 stop:2482 length:2430 start_codon:yes stop_codon:yes gene_type:complete
VSRLLLASISLFFLLSGVLSSNGFALEIRHIIDKKSIRLNKLECLISESPVESHKLKKSISDFNALWASHMGCLLKVERTGFGKAKGIYLSKSDLLKSKKKGSFLIRKKCGHIFINARDEDGLANALYYIAHNLLGARWYWPTPLGFETVGQVPKKWRLNRILEEPSFTMRSLHGSDAEYQLRNRLSGGYSFNHNLARIFKPEIQSSVPNIFADLGDRKIKHKGSTSFDPQPNLTQEGAVELAALAAIHYFENNPSAKSFSLSPNDNILYDTTEATKHAVSPLAYFRKRPNYTDMTFQFANQVAHKVFNEAGLWKTDQEENRYLGMLAYYWAEQSPSIPLHPRILPILTSDRAQWHDPIYRNEDRALIKRWGKTEAEKIGSWDYYFGAPYPYPRQMTQWIAESLPYLQENRVDIFFSQLPSMWGLDGLKAWLATQLLWNVDRETEDLLNEFYDEFFGDASQAIRAFYEIAESHRNKNEGAANWIKFYFDESGIELFSEPVLEEMRSYIEDAISLVDSSTRYYRRLAIVSEAFELTEFYYDYHSARLDLLSYIADKEATGGIEKVRNLELKREQYLKRTEELINNPLHKHFNYFLKLGQTDPIPCSIVPILRGQDTIDEAFKKRYEKELSIGKDWINASQLFETRIGNPLLKASFENAKERDFLGPKIPEINYWQVDFRPAEAFAIGPCSLIEDQFKGLRITNADAFQLYTLSLLAPQRDYFLTAKIRSKISPDCRAQLRLDWVNEAGIRFESLRIIQLPNGESNGLLQLEIPLIAPEVAEKAKISLLVQRQGEGDFIEIQEINFLQGFR